MKHFTEYLNYLIVEKNVSDHTIRAYKTRLNKFFNFIQATHDTLETIVEPSNVREFINYLNKDYKRNSILHHVNVIKSYFSFLVEQGYVAKNPTEKIKFETNETRLPKFLTKDQMKQLLNTSKQMGMKYELIINLLYGIGGRVSEIASLKLEDINFVDHTVSIIGKGNKERCNPIAPQTNEMLKKFCKAYKIESGFIFPHKTKKGQHITTTALFLAVKEIAKKAGICPSLVSPHKFRHSYAQHLLDNSCDLSIIQELLGHADINTTKIYTKVTINNKQDRYLKHHPLATL